MINPDDLLPDNKRELLESPGLLEQSGIFLTNNPFILVTKLVSQCLGSADMDGFTYVRAAGSGGADEEYHGLFMKDHVYYVDLMKIKYSAYPLLIKVLDMIIPMNRIDGHKIVLIINQFDMVLQQQIGKFVAYAEKWSHTTTFLFVGAGNRMSYFLNRSKLGKLCVPYRILYGPLCNVPGVDPETAKKVHRLVQGDILKSWLVLQSAKGHGLSDLLDVLPMYKQIYRLMDKRVPIDICYSIMSFPGVTITKVFSALVRMTQIDPQVPQATRATVLRLAAEIGRFDTADPCPEEPILLMMAFAAQLSALLNKI